ncbi:amidohydrolase [bacterium TMED277]|nr:MAG: amidohydrolase [bacterium TMED277]
MKKKPIDKQILETQEEIVSIRRKIHELPELMFDTFKTSQLVAEKLRLFGVDEVVEGVGRTGVIGKIKGDKNTKNKVIALRADMDALPITEKTNLPYSSKVEGVMHACGHDGHTAMLLGAAKYLSKNRDFDGEVILIFQPAEEGGGGGKEMVETGFLDKFGVQEVYGMHNWPGLSKGSFAIKSGKFFAAADFFTILVEGEGGHAANPHTTVDTTLVASQIVSSIQAIAARNVDPLKSIVVSVCSFITDTDAHNVIPGTVVLKGTVRTMENEMRDLAEKNLSLICENTARAFGASATVDYKRGYPVMTNSEKETEIAKEIGYSVTGNETIDVPPVMGAEDFSFMLNERPGAYILIGNGESAPVHNPNYNFDDDIISTGVAYWTQLTKSRLRTH